AFLEGMQDAGWEVGRNLHIEYRWSVGDRARLSRDARELVTLNPDVILAGVGGTTSVLQQATHVVPIVFAQAIDPVGNGYVDSLNRPGGNITGFVQLDYGLAGKMLNLPQDGSAQIKPGAVTRETGQAANEHRATMKGAAQQFDKDK